MLFLLHLFNLLSFSTLSYSINIFPEPLDKDTEEKLIKDMLNGDTSARNKLIEHNLRLVAHIVKKFEKVNGNINDDLISIGTIGLIKGIDSYKLDKKSKLVTYAARCIENAHLTLRNYKTYSKRRSICCKERYKRILL